MVLAFGLPVSGFPEQPAITPPWPSLDHARGKVVLLDFWASWCAPCRKSLPWLDELQKRYRDAGLEVIAVNVDKDRKLAEAFLARIPLSLRLEFDPDGRVAEALGVQAMPTSILIDRSGTIRQRYRGFRAEEESQRERQISELLVERFP